MTSTKKRDRLDKEFIKEYIKLCQKYKRKFWVDYWETFIVEDLENDEDHIFVCGVNTRAEREEQHRIREENERKRKEEEQRRWEEEHKKIVEAHLAAGGTLDENGNIPIPEGYCQVINWQVEE